MSYETQGTGYDPKAVGYELQGRDKKPERLNAHAAFWMLAWHGRAMTAKACSARKSHMSARLHARHARTCYREMVKAL